MAIQVGGTNVITDTRALNNVTSIDSTTASAIGNAGVGGATSILVDNASISNATSFLSIDFTAGYDKYIVSLSKILVPGYGFTNLKLYNTSNTLVGGVSHGFHSQSSTGAGNGARGVTTAPLHMVATGGTEFINAVINVWYPYSSTRQTFITFNHHIDRSSSPRDVTGGSLVQGYTGTITQCNKMEIHNSNTNFANGGYYSVWGVNL